jgi:Tol biopolymer transport system component
MRIPSPFQASTRLARLVGTSCVADRDGEAESRTRASVGVGSNQTGMGQRVLLATLFGGIALAMTLITTSSGSSSAGATSRSSLKGTIAFLSGSRVPNGIYLMRPDGSGVRRLENNQENSATPAWSPDGKRIAFSSNRGGEPHQSIYVVNANGSGLQRVTHPKASTDDGSPSWSPDGRRIVFEANVNGELGISLVNADGSGRRVLTADGEAPAWSPGGRRIAFSRQYGRGKCGTAYSQIWLANPDGSGLRVLTHNCVDHNDPELVTQGPLDRLLGESNARSRQLARPALGGKRPRHGAATAYPGPLRPRLACMVTGWAPNCLHPHAEHPGRQPAVQYLRHQREWKRAATPYPFGR